MDFSAFGLDERIMEGIEAMNYQAATPVQQKVIPEILNGRDLIACAQTGTGKTAAFLLPLLHQIINGPQEDDIKAMIIVPTRELAVQISQHIEGFAYFTNVSSLAIYGGGGGTDYAQEKTAITRGVDVVVCTPGRMISHLNLGYVKLEKLQFLVLDEADRMLDMGFYEDILKIISYLPKKRQSLLFSATMPDKIRQLARKILQNPLDINIAISKPPEKIQQEAYVLYDDQKNPMVKQLVKDDRLNSILVFCETKTAVKQLSRELKKNGLGVEEIHSDLEQKEREAVMNRFKSRKIRVLVATDIISRGIDVEDIEMVVNFNVPADAEDYVHRIGRTARAESVGKACTLIGPKEQRRFASIEKMLQREIPKMEVPESLGKTPEYKPSERPAFIRQKKRFGKSRGKGGPKKPFRSRQKGKPGN